ncbi:N-acylneuraminate cytidylyltransferase [Flavobacterium flevense]|uniref:N-acylneuraminate cytidylyltransferase n=1 Tax=Flavobacterium flevense TaxID=983 RepID=A0A4Y4B4U1_9FLAO|nr:acylneuraminate cytidylyltransferase [Flavobacterium flevense]GEC73673.1 acylneuraminate cytidylyltransferase [Flavobacterium flevense]SHL99993.1 N-acylneuraminate cytidylyltransferase [Flavobacterium flevense]
MKKTAIIPLRKESKGIPGKNKKKMLGRPLFSWVLTEAVFSNLDEVYVFTDDQEIIDYIHKEYHWTSKVKTLLRSAENATDTASTESAMLEFTAQLQNSFEILCLLQATSPMTIAADINAVLDKIEIEKYDSALTVVNSHRFTWNTDGTPQNYDVFNRPRRQDFEGLLIENGAVYATTTPAFVETKNRVSGKIGLVPMGESTLVEIDSVTDWKIVEELLAARLKKAKKHQRIDYLVLDVDGVFTDGKVAYSTEGELTKVFDMRDGMGLEILRQNQVEVVVITSENSALVAQRMQKLQIEYTFLVVKDKYAFLQYFAKDRNTSFAAMAYIGDDVNDLANICSVGWSFAPANATEIARQNADYLLTNKSAEGAIREACEWIIKYNERY